MKKFHWIVVLLSAVFLAGCASGPKALSKNDPNSPSGDLDGDSIVNSIRPEIAISVAGHTDNRGPAAANLELSKQRVLSVVKYMVANGITTDRIMPVGFGESRPIAANATAEGREQNRRIEIQVLEDLL